MTQNSLRWVALLSALVVASAFSVVAVRHLNRVEFYQVQKLQAKRDQLAIEWRQLRAEKATWRLENSVEVEVREKRQMRTPELVSIETINLSERHLDSIK